MGRSAAAYCCCSPGPAISVWLYTACLVCTTPMMCFSWALVSAHSRDRLRGREPSSGDTGLSAVHVPGDGWLHKAVGVGSKMHIIEELQIFSPGQPVQNLLLDTNRVSELGRKPRGVCSAAPLSLMHRLQPAFPRWHQQDGKVQTHGMSQQTVGYLGA